MKRSVLLKIISSRKQLQKLKNLSNRMNIKAFYLDGIPYYKGRILTTEKTNASCEMSTVMKDLC